MESDSALHGDVPDGAEVSPLEDNQDNTAEAAENNVSSQEEAAAAEESGNCVYTFVITTLD